MPYPSLHDLPTTREQWQSTARAAAGLLLIDSAKLYGFVTGGPEINTDRCEEILALAAAQGIDISIDQATDAGLALINGFDAEVEADA